MHQYLKTFFQGNVIDGKLVPPKGGKYLDVINPSDESIFGQSAASTKDDVDAAVAAGKSAYPGWKTTSGKDRALILEKIAAVIEQNSADISRKEAINSGKPLKETAWDISDVVACFRKFSSRHDYVPEGKCELPPD
jgi:acyl-CoA reductase-like NAD-dependent aldehyde dehydrogenase